MSVASPKQEQFVLEYLKDLNATQAAIRAGYAKKTAYSQGQRLLKKVEVQAAIQRAMNKRSNEVRIDANDVLREIAKLAFVDPRELFDENGRLLPVKQLPDAIAASIASVEVVTSRAPGGEPTEVEHTSKIKFWDKRASLELLGKHLKLFTDKTEVKHSIGPSAEDLAKLDPKELEAYEAIMSKLAGGGE